MGLLHQRAPHQGRAFHVVYHRRYHARRGHRRGLYPQRQHGGTDIIAAIINKYKPITLGRSILYCDLLIISSSYMLFHDMEKIVFGFVVLAVSTYSCDLLINGIRQSIQLLIFSDKYEEIADHINRDINRGVTILDGMGWYSKQPKKVIVVLAKRTESTSIFRLVKQIDSHAFISQSNVIGVYGEGFDKIKT